MIREALDKLDRQETELAMARRFLATRDLIPCVRHEIEEFVRVTTVSIKQQRNCEKSLRMKRPDIFVEG